MRQSAVLLCILFLIGFLCGNAEAKPLISDISSHSITLHTAFEGTELMLFGARNEPGDVLVVVRGPAQKATVRRKERVRGVWVNRAREKFQNVPGFLAMASSRPFEEIEKSHYFKALGLGYEEAITPLRPRASATDTKFPTLGVPEFRDALLRYLRNNRLYGEDIAEVKFIGETLFRTIIPFPDNMPRGVYTAEVYLLSEGGVVATQIIPIQVRKIGVDAFLSENATEHPYLYGLASVLLALLFGWGASVVFQRI